MPKPLVSNDPKPKDPSFSHFGVLDDGTRSKGAAVTSTVVNGLIILFLVVVSAIVKTNPQLAAKITPLYTPPVVKKEPPPKPPPLPKPPPVLPKPPKLIEQPRKIDLPKPIETPPDIKPMPAPPVPKPVQLSTPAPKAVAAMAAPKVVNMNMSAKAASIANNDAHPSPVRLGNPEIKALNGPAVATPVNLAGGMHGMPASNTGSGPVGKVSLGNGSPGGTATRGGGVVAVTGLKNGVPGGTGTGTHGPVVVNGLSTQVAKAAPPPPASIKAPLAHPPVITGVPKAVRTPDAVANKISGDVRVSVVLNANGSVSVGSVVSGLGHGLDQVARNVAAGMRFTPAKDTAGNSIDFPTVVTIHFLTND